MSYTGSYSFNFDGLSTNVIKPILYYEVVQEPERNSSVVYLTLQFRTGGYSDQNEMRIANSTLEVESSKRSNMDNVFGPIGYYRAKTIQTLAVRVSHDRNGHRSARIKAHGTLFSNIDNFSYSIDRIINLPQIIVEPTITSIRFNSDLVYNQSNSIVYSLSVPPDSENFFDISLSEGNISRLDYEEVSSGSNQTLTITADEVNTLIELMAGSRNKIFKVTVYEWDPSGSGGVISSSETNITATTEPIINADNTPTVSINGDGVDSQMGLYIQNITQIDFDLNPQLNSGATLASATTTIERVGGGFYQTINGASGTRNVLTQAGTYNISGIVVDNKGIRMRSKTAQFTVTAYSPPSINSLQAQRQEREVTTADVTVTTSHDRISGNNITNRLEVSVQRKNEQGQWVNVASFSDDLGANENEQIYTTTVLNNNESLSYDYRVVVTDSFSRTTESITTLPAGKIVLDIHKNLGVGIGKFHEQGALDVEGESYFLGDMSLTGGGFYNGAVTADNKLQTKSQVDTAISTAVGSIDLSDYVESTALETTLNDYVTNSSFNKALGDYALNIALSDYVKSSDLIYGRNNFGRYIKFPNRVLICWNTITITTEDARNTTAYWTFPHMFSAATDYINTFASQTSYSGAYRYTNGQFGISPDDSMSHYPRRRAAVVFSHNSKDANLAGENYPVNVMAIGLW